MTEAEKANTFARLLALQRDILDIGTLLSQARARGQTAAVAEQLQRLEIASAEVRRIINLPELLPQALREILLAGLTQAEQLMPKAETPVRN